MMPKTAEGYFELIYKAYPKETTNFRKEHILLCKNKEACQTLFMAITRNDERIAKMLFNMMLQRLMIELRCGAKNIATLWDAILTHKIKEECHDVLGTH